MSLLVEALIRLYGLLLVVPDTDEFVTPAGHNKGFTHTDIHPIYATYVEWKTYTLELLFLFWNIG